MNLNTYKTCGVPVCKNTSIQTPNKLFLHVPNQKRIRDEWLKLARRNPNSIRSTKSHLYFCEDHFDLPNDMDNYMEYRVMGFVQRVRMKPGCIPTKLKQELDMKMKTSEPTDQQNVDKTQKMMLDDCDRSNINKIVTEQIKCEESYSSDSETPCAADNADPLSQDGRPQCRFCGEFTKHFVDTDAELSYVTDNKTSLSVNGINVEIDFNDQAPKTVCVHCNKKLKEMLDFVTLVKFAQDNLIDLGAENRELLIIKTEYDSNDDDDDNGKDKDDTNEGEIDTAEKSGFGETSTHKRKSNETTASKRKKTKVEETESEESNLLIDIKEEVMIEEYTDEPETSTNVIVKSEPDINDVTIETDNGNDANEENETNETNLGFREEKAEPPDQASELEMATRTLLNELGGDGTAAGQKGHYG